MYKRQEQGLAEAEGHPGIRCFVSDDPVSFALHAEQFLGFPLSHPVERVEIDRYEP